MYIYTYMDILPGCSRYASTEDYQKGEFLSWYLTNLYVIPPKLQ